MIFKKFEVNPFSQNTYLVHNSSQAILIDAGFYSDKEFADFYSYVDKNHLTLQAILLTHAHIDHVVGLNKLVEDFQIPVYLHPDDQILLHQVHAQGQLFGFSINEITLTPLALMEQSKFSFSDFEIEILFTPGHAPGHVSLYFESEKTVVSGDVLFAGSVGRTDLYKGNFEILAQSIKEKLYSLPDDTIVLAGHGPQTTIKRERLTNPYVKG